MESIIPTDGPYVIYQGKKLLDFSSLDFLGLSQHPEVKKAAIKYTLKYGVGAGCGSPPEQEIASKLAHYMGEQQVLLFSSFSDLHAQVEAGEGTIISTETNSAPSSKKGKGLRIADETCLIGITGSNGFRSASSLTGVDAICGSLLNGTVHFIAGPKKALASYQARAMTSGISFPTLGALDCAISFIPEMEPERKLLQKHQAWLMKQLSPWKIQERPSPRAMWTAENADAIRNFFLQEEIYLAPPHNHMLYIATTALHTPDDLDQLAIVLKKLATTDLARAMQSLTLTP